jgi:hypothetical protein
MAIKARLSGLREPRQERWETGLAISANNSCAPVIHS